LAARIPPNPEPMMTTCGRLITVNAIDVNAIDADVP
jgi:hypothetical protein